MKAAREPFWWRNGLNTETVALLLILTITIIRFFYAWALPLTADEAYYWQWSRHLAWGYFDHPPMIAYLIRVGVDIAGINPLGVRLLPILMAGGIAWMVFQMAQSLAIRREVGIWALAMTLFTPIFSAGAVLSTPDAPLVFFWTAAILFTLKAVRSSCNKDWIAAGLMMGLGLISKFPMVLLPAAILLALVFTKKGRTILVSPGPWVGAISGVIVCLPYIVWNITTGWSSVLYQLGHGLGSSDGFNRLSSFMLFIGGQVGVTGFLIFPIVLAALYHGLKRWHDPAAPEEQRLYTAFLTAPALMTLLVFGAASLMSESGPNWTVAMYPTSFVLAGWMITGWSRKGTSFAVAALSLAALLSVYAQIETIKPIVPYNPKGLFSEVQNRDEFAIWADEVRNSRGEEAKNAPVMADSYQLASLLAFYLPDHPDTDSPGERGSGLEYLRWRKGWNEGELVWFFTTRDSTPGYFMQLETVDTLTESRLGKVVDVISAKLGRLKAAR